MTIKSDLQLDCKGLACPMPIVKTKKAMTDINDGQIIEIQATDKGSISDLRAWSESVGHQYIGNTEQNGVIVHYIRKSGDSNVSERKFENTIRNDEIIDRSSNGGIILDVREEAEYAFGHIKGAKSIPIGELQARLEELDKDSEIYVVCRTGVRSDLAAQKLADKGFSKVYNVLPGMSSWNGDLSKKI